MINFLRKKKTESALEKNKRDKSFLNYKDIANILIIFNTCDLDDITGVVKSLQDDGKSVTAWTIQPKDKTLQITYPPYVRAIDSKDTTWSQALSKPVADEFDKLAYDTFLDLTTSDDVVLDYLLASNSSRFCIGIRERQIKAYDFIMLKQEEHSITDTYKQMKYYLEKIVG